MSLQALLAGAEPGWWTESGSHVPFVQNLQTYERPTRVLGDQEAV